MSLPWGWRAILAAGVIACTLSLLALHVWTQPNESTSWEAVLNKHLSGRRLSLRQTVALHQVRSQDKPHQLELEKIRLHQSDGELYREVAQHSWGCKFSLLRYAGFYLDSEHAAGTQFRDMYRGLLLSHLLAEDGHFVAADMAADEAAAALGYRWSDFAPLAIRARQLLGPHWAAPAAARLPACAEEWSILRRLFDSGAVTFPGLLEYYDTELRDLWLDGMSAQYGYSASHRLTCAGQMEVADKGGQAMLLWALPVSFYEPNVMMWSHAFGLKSFGQFHGWRLVIDFEDANCTVLGIMPDRPLARQHSLIMRYNVVVRDAEGNTLASSCEEEVAVSREHYVVGEAGSWHPFMLPVGSCVPFPPPVSEPLPPRGELLVMTLIQDITEAEASCGEDCDPSAASARLPTAAELVLQPNKYYRLAPEAFMHQWGLPPGSPGFVQSATLARGSLLEPWGLARAPPTQRTFTLPGDPEQWESGPAGSAAGAPSCGGGGGSVDGSPAGTGGERGGSRGGTAADATAQAASSGDAAAAAAAAASSAAGAGPERAATEASGCLPGGTIGGGPQGDSDGGCQNQRGCQALLGAQPTLAHTGSPLLPAASPRATFLVQTELGEVLEHSLALVWSVAHWHIKASLGLALCICLLVYALRAQPTFSTPARASLGTRVLARAYLLMGMMAPQGSRKVVEELLLCFALLYKRPWWVGLGVTAMSEVVGQRHQACRKHLCWSHPQMILGSFLVGRWMVEWCWVPAFEMLAPGAAEVLRPEVHGVDGVSLATLVGLAMVTSAQIRSRGYDVELKTFSLEEGTTWYHLNFRLLCFLAAACSVVSNPLRAMWQAAGQLTPDLPGPQTAFCLATMIMMWGSWMHVVLTANYVDLSATFELELMSAFDVGHPESTERPWCLWAAKMLLEELDGTSETLRPRTTRKELTAEEFWSMPRGAKRKQRLAPFMVEDEDATYTEIVINPAFKLSALSIPPLDIFLAMSVFVAVEAFAGSLTAAYIWLLLTPVRLAMLPLRLLSLAPWRLGAWLLEWLGSGDQAAARERLEDAAAAALVSAQRLCSAAAAAAQALWKGIWNPIKALAWPQARPKKKPSSAVAARAALPAKRGSGRGGAGGSSRPRQQAAAAPAQSQPASPPRPPQQATLEADSLQQPVPSLTQQGQEQAPGSEPLQLSRQSSGRGPAVRVEKPAELLQLTSPKKPAVTPSQPMPPEPRPAEAPAVAIPPAQLLPLAVGPSAAATATGPAAGGEPGPLATTAAALAALESAPDVAAQQLAAAAASEPALAPAQGLPQAAPSPDPPPAKTDVHQPKGATQRKERRQRGIRGRGAAREAHPAGDAQNSAAGAAAGPAGEAGSAPPGQDSGRPRGRRQAAAPTGDGQPARRGQRKNETGTDAAAAAAAFPTHPRLLTPASPCAAPLPPLAPPPDTPSQQPRAPAAPPPAAATVAAAAPAPKVPAWRPPPAQEQPLPQRQQQQQVALPLVVGLLAEEQQAAAPGHATEISITQPVGAAHQALLAAAAAPQAGPPPATPALRPRYNPVVFSQPASQPAGGPAAAYPQPAAGPGALGVAGTSTGALPLQSAAFPSAMHAGPQASPLASFAQAPPQGGAVGTSAIWGWHNPTEGLLSSLAGGLVGGWGGAAPATQAMGRPSVDGTASLQNSLELDLLPSVLSGGSMSSAAAMLECVMCLDALRETTLAPCGHRALCLPCTERLMGHEGQGDGPLCPICRKRVRSYIQKEFVA